MSTGAKRRKKLLSYLYSLILVVIALFMISPIIWMISASFQNNGEIYQSSFQWIPEVFRWENYETAWNVAKIGTALKNTAIVSAIMVIAQLFLCTLAGYAIAKYNFRFKKIIVVFIMATMMLPQEITYFPVYSLMADMHLLNTYIGLALPFFMSGFGVFLMMQFAQYVPNELMESARIDGCREWGIFFRISLPIMKASLSSLAILAFTFIWNEYAWAKLAVSSNAMKTVTITLSMLANNSENQIQTSALLAASVVAILPIMVVFVCFQKNFIESVTRSGVKG